MYHNRWIGRIKASKPAAPESCKGVNLAPYLFVYGTLMQGFYEAWQKKAGARLVGKGTIKAKLYDLDDYPGAKLAGAGSAHCVTGELYRLRDPELATRILDEYEEFSPAAPSKSLFLRRLVRVTLEGGRIRRAWAYLYHRAADESKLIPGGDYRSRAGRVRGR